ncbi:DciA family protein [Methyloversatilis thermotolerans]|uniref:DciA family protein n=1 Tax=Methyloversatilis thermotolerans TaxID=1346290 RepID=UPI001E4365DA|nr:DciA family protein [Methyloversatilis thermotolerans]
MLANLSLHAQRIARAQTAYEKFMPAELTQVSRVMNVKQGVVVVSASSSAVAHRLKQLLPSLRQAMQESCGEVTEVKVKVQAFDPPRIRPASPVRPVSVPARKAVLEGAARLRGDSPLKQALEHLVSRALRSDGESGQD